jgi:hypothetical protein
VAHIRAGRMKAYAITSTARSRFDGLTEVPTVVEQGYPGLLMRIWQGCWRRAARRRRAQQRLARAVQAALRDEKLLGRFRDLATEAVPQEQASPAYFTRHIGRGRRPLAADHPGGRAVRRLIARHTVSAVSGMSSVVTPSGASASSTACTTTCGAAMQPAWPMPFTPSGLRAVGSSFEHNLKRWQVRGAG